MTESISPLSPPTPEIRYQPSLLSLRSSAATVAPEAETARLVQKPERAAPRRRLWFFVAVSAFVGTAGLSSLSAPSVSSRVHSGSPGYRQSRTGKNLRWQKQAVTVYLDPSLQHLGPGANEAVMQAFGQWISADPHLPNLSFDTGNTSSAPVQDGKSTVSYARITAAGHERDVAITVSYSNDQTGEIIEADVVLNSLYPIAVLTARPPAPAGEGDDEAKDKGKSDAAAKKGSTSGSTSKSMLGSSETVDCGNRYDAQDVITHESGHFFGLGEDLTETRATMFLRIDQCEAHKRALAATDVGAMTTLYADSPDSPQAAAGPRACSFGGAPAGSTGLSWLSGAIFGLSVLRRRRGG